MGVWFGCVWGWMDGGRMEKKGPIHMYMYVYGYRVHNTSQICMYMYMYLAESHR